MSPHLKQTEQPGMILYVHECVCIYEKKKEDEKLLLKVLSKPGTKPNATERGF